MIIIFLGQPGSGKGTQAKLLSKEFNWPHFSIGQILREEFARKTDLGIQGEKYWGELGINVPTAISFALLRHKIDDVDNFILDNFPRSLENLNILKEYLKRRNLKIDFVFHLDLKFETALKRLKKRAFEDEYKHGQKRLDETDELIKVRFEKGYQEVKDIINYFSSQKVLFNLNADQPIMMLHGRIKEIIQNAKLA